MVRFILTALLILLITLAYHKPLMALYEDYIITPLLKPFESNIGVGLITVVVGLFVGYCKAMQDKIPV